MDDRVVKFRVGVMVLATMFIAGILVLLFGDARGLVRGSYTIHIHFTDAPGVTDGTPVRKSGILIGRVTKVEFAKQGGVMVEAKIDGNVKLYRNEVPQVSGSLLGGDVVIQFVRRANGPPPPATPPPGQTTSRRDGTTLTAQVQDEPAAAAAARAVAPEAQEVQPGEFIEGSVAPNAFQVITNLENELGTAVGALSSAGTEVGKVAANINKLIEGNDAQINRIVDKTETTLDSFLRALGDVEDVIGDEQVRDNIKSMLRDMPELMSDTRSAINTIRTTVESVDRNMRNLEGFTGPLGERGEGLVERIDRTMARMDEMLAEFSDFGKKLNSGEGSLGQLIRNPELYQHLNTAACNIEKLTRELQPILSDVRVFSDKISRHPELLGVRGAIQNSPGIK
ncbi:MAG TPA: MlaD family protein [Pirellulales bacterium]|jgi:phospholipid/cholesterol/gamma-HCH transport system substrate-binding protein|nr:MlaD family protein [Pirellulales bacterium]